MSSLTLITLHAVAIGGSFLIACGVDRIRKRRERAMVFVRSIPPEHRAGHESPPHPTAGATRNNVLQMPGRTDPAQTLYRTLPQEIV